MRQEEKIALIDLDGSAADYDLVMKQELNKLRHPSEPPVTDRYADREEVEGKEAPHLEARRKLIQAKPGFWRTIPKHPLGFEVIDEMRMLGFKLNVLTKGPSSTPGAWTEKFEWSQINIPDADVTVTENKALSYGRVLLDDWPPYFISWHLYRPRGLVICVAQPWNANMEKILQDAHDAGIEQPNILRYDGTNRTELKEKLKWAHNR